jgi:hypothetical protein
LTDVPGKIINESVDPFHMTSVDYFEQWGREPAQRFIDRFAKFGLTEKVIRPSYGLAEATLYVASPPISRPPRRRCVGTKACSKS